MTDLPESEKPKRVRVYCSQWAQCGWSGYRRSSGTGVQPAPCPICGGKVVR